MVFKQIKKGINKSLDTSTKLLQPGKPINVGLIQRTPQTILSKEQRMLNALFNDKNQLWGNGEPVVITNHLQTGNGLIKTGTGSMTRRLFLP
jgi:hypothetical protein